MTGFSDAASCPFRTADAGTLRSTRAETPLPPKIVRSGRDFLDFKRTADDASFPEDFAAYIRSHGEIYHWPAGGFHVITRDADARQILKSKSFTNDRTAFFASMMADIDPRLIGDFFGASPRSASPQASPRCEITTRWSSLASQSFT